MPDGSVAQAPLDASNGHRPGHASAAEARVLDAGPDEPLDADPEADAGAELASTDAGGPHLETLPCLEGPASVFAGDYDHASDAWPSPDLRGIRVVQGSVSVPLGFDFRELGGCLERVDGDLTLSTLVGWGQVPTRLDGLQQLRSVGGTLKVYDGHGASIEFGGQTVPLLQGLDGLSGLERVAGDLIVDGSLLRSLHGLERLRSVGGDFALASAQLSDLRALSALERVAGELRILGSHGDRLRDLHGLEGLSELGGLNVIWAQALQSLDGLAPIARMPGGVRLSELPSLVSIAALAPLTELGGDLVIDHASGFRDLSPLSSLTRVASLYLLQTPVQSLDGLGGLVEIGGELGIVQTEIDSLASLTSLQRVGSLLVSDQPGAFSLEGLPGPALEALSIIATSITSLAGLEQIQVVHGDVRIANNPDLTDLVGLSHLHTIDGALQLQDGALQSLMGLDALQRVGTALAIVRQPDLVSLNGAPGLARAGQVFLSDDPGLTTLDGLQALARIDQALSIESLASLASLHGLEGLSRVGAVALRNNPLLSDVAALHGADNSGGQLVVLDNPALSRCDATALANQMNTHCSCPGGLNAACACVSVCDCTGNDNSAASCP